ncbi:NifU family protein [Arthrobacter crystallopoietes]|uniref:NifU family protein n=1 Tax=Crystallibacter crystallopoietes TaxID=37928 RepID=UPI003D19A179
MAAGEQPRRAGDRIGTLLDALGAGGAVARERAEDLVREVTDLYGAGLERLLDILRNRGALDAGTMNALVSDELVSALLLIHNLHPQDLHARVAAALDSVRPYLGSHGGDVELLGINDDGVVRLRLLGTCHGCPSSSVTLKYAVEDAIEAAAPEVAAIEVVEAEKAAASPAVIPVEALRIRLAHDPDGPALMGGPAGTPGGLSGGSPGGSWEPLPELAELEPGEVAGFLVGGSRILACRIGQDLYAYRDYCPRCTRSLEGAALQRALAAPSGGGLLRCPSCRSHFDVRLAGACVEDGTMHLDPLPLLSRGGVMSVAVPQSAGHGG